MKSACKICRRKFRNTKAFKDHVKSELHKTQVELKKTETNASHGNK